MRWWINEKSGAWCFSRMISLRDDDGKRTSAGLIRGLGESREVPDGERLGCARNESMTAAARRSGPSNDKTRAAISKPLQSTNSFSASPSTGGNTADIAKRHGRQRFHGFSQRSSGSSCSVRGWDESLAYFIREIFLPERVPTTRFRATGCKIRCASDRSSVETPRCGVDAPSRARLVKATLGGVFDKVRCA